MSEHRTDAERCMATGIPVAYMSVRALLDELDDLTARLASESRALAEARADAWDEGYQARKGEGWQSPGADNPYRDIP